MAAAGKWSNYVIEPVELTVTGSGGNWDTSAAVDSSSGGYMRAKINNECAYAELPAYTYDIDLNVDTDRYFRFRKSLDKGITWENAGTSSEWYYIDGKDNTANAGGKNWYPVENPLLLNGEYWTSIDKGVQIWFSSDDAFDGNEEIQFTLPTGNISESQKKFINGFSTYLAIPTDGGDNTYTDLIPSLNGDSYTVVWNYSKLLLNRIGSGNDGNTLRFVYSADGTTFTLGKCTHDDLRVHIADLVKHVAIFDKKASGRTNYTHTEMGDYPNGGDFPYYKMELLFEALSGGESTHGHNQYVNVALIKNY